MTRPRCSGSTDSWTQALAIAWKARLTRPIAASRGRKAGSPGAIAAVTCRSPNRPDAAMMTRSRGRAPAAASSAPAADPVAMTMLNRP